MIYEWVGRKSLLRGARRISLSSNFRALN